MNDLVIQARRANIEEYLKNTGRVLLKEGRQYRVKNYSGLVVFENRWYSHTLSKGGNTLDFLIKMDHIDFNKAVGILSSMSNAIVETEKSIESRHLDVPKRNTDDKRILAYLVKTRMLSIDVIMPLIKQTRIYEALNTHNCVLTGVDQDLSIRYVMQRSSLPNNSLKFESKGSDKRYSFSLKGKTDILCVFESPIDLLSYMTIFYGSSRCYSHMLSLGGTSNIALTSYISRNPEISKIVFCLDNDKAGVQAYTSFYNTYSSNGFIVYKHFPEKKDWNLQLLSRVD